MVAMPGLYGDLDTVLDPEYHRSDDDVEGSRSATKRAVARVAITDADIRCNGKIPMRDGTHKTCNKYMAKLAGRPWILECPRCHTVNRSPDD